MNKYLIRLDDACPTMDSKKWHRVEDILDSYGIKPMVGVIPNNEDPEQQLEREDIHFWDKVHTWKDKGWAIALHGYNHCYISTNAGINPLWNRSEFAGVPIDFQREKIRKGVAIFREHGLNPQYFFAPSHTFDENTLTALKEESDIRVISDTVGVKPYKRGEFIFIPQFGAQCREMPINGLFTFCFHPSTMMEMDFVSLENFIFSHKTDFCNFIDIDLHDAKRKSVVDRFISWVYFTRRKLRRIK